MSSPRLQHPETQDFFTSALYALSMNFSDSPIPTIPFHDGHRIPQLGFGTYKVTDGAYTAVRSALDLGYRHIDTAQLYGNEAEVGRAVADSGIDREDIFITSKLRNDAHEPAETKRAFEQSLRDLRTEYLDLFLIHWPLPMHYDGNIALPWPTMEYLFDQEKTLAIGVSNFHIPHLQALMAVAQVIPHVNQVEIHPYLHNNELRRFHASHGIVTQAWSPLARGRIFGDPVLEAIATDLGISVSQVALRWAIQRNEVVFPKASTPERQAQNLDIFSFELSEAHMAAIAQLDKGEDGRTGSHPDTMDRLKL